MNRSMAKAQSTMPSAAACCAFCSAAAFSFILSILTLNVLLGVLLLLCALIIGIRIILALVRRNLSQTEPA